MSLIVNREAPNKVPIVFIKKIPSSRKEELISFCIQETKEKLENIYKDYSNYVIQLLKAFSCKM